MQPNYTNNNAQQSENNLDQQSNETVYVAPSELPAQAYARALYPFKGELSYIDFCFSNFLVQFIGKS